LLFCREADCLAAKLRPGNVHSAGEWEELLLPENERQQKRGRELVFPADAASAKPEVYEALEERGVKCAIRIPANRSLEQQWIKEGKQAVKMTRRSCHRCRSNEVRLGLSLIAHYLENLWRGGPLGPVLPLRVGNWSLTSLQQRWVKTGGRLIKHARYYWLLPAEGHLTRRPFAAMVRRMEALPVPTG
jgi:hypothetical protein